MQSRRFRAVHFQAGWLLHAVLSGRTGGGTKSPSRSTLWQFANYFVMPGQLWSCLSCCFLAQSHVTKKTISQNSTWVPSLSRREVFAILWLDCVAFFRFLFLSELLLSLGFPIVDIIQYKKLWGLGQLGCSLHGRGQAAPFPSCFCCCQSPSTFQGKIHSGSYLAPTLTVSYFSLCLFVCVPSLIKIPGASY